MDYFERDPRGFDRNWVGIGSQLTNNNNTDTSDEC
jgi:hypothetical protein